MHALLEFCRLLFELILMAEMVIVGFAFMLIKIFDVASFFRHLLKKWREEGEGLKRENNETISRFYYPPGFGRVSPRDYQAIHELYRKARNYEIQEPSQVNLHLVRETPTNASEDSLIH